MDLTREPEDPAIVSPVRAKTGQSPRTPSVVLRACKPRPAGRARGDFLVHLAHAHRFAFCPFAPRVRRATNFFLASVLLRQAALRPPDEDDARCVQPTSATQSNCVHPHLVCSRLALATFAAGGYLTENKAPCGFPGDRMFHDIRERFGGSSSRREILMLYCLTAWSHERGRFAPTALMRPSL